MLRFRTFESYTIFCLLLDFVKIIYCVDWKMGQLSGRARLKFSRYTPLVHNLFDILVLQWVSLSITDNVGEDKAVQTIFIQATSLLLTFRRVPNKDINRLLMELKERKCVFFVSLVLTQCRRGFLNGK